MNYLRIFRIALCAAAFALASFPCSSLAAQTPDSEEITKLLSEAKTHAILAEDDAATLHSYTRSGLAWQTHANRLSMMKEHINDLGKTAKQLNDLKSTGSPWQQVAIDRINPLLREMADTLTATIEHLNKNQSQIHMSKYRDYAEANYDLASRTTAMIKDFVDYGKAKEKSEDLERTLELPTGSSE